MISKFLRVLLACAVTLTISALAQTGSAATPSGSAATPASAPAPNTGTKVGAINIEAAVFGCNEGSRDLEGLRKKFEPKQNELKTQNDELEGLKKQLTTTGDKLSPEALDTLKKQIESKQKESENQKSPSFRTPSGKIEICSEIAARINDSLIPTIPTYMETWESLNDPLARKYPLQLITPHLKRRAHSQFDNLPWLRELQTQAITINTVDADSRGIRPGDLVRVFNDGGKSGFRPR